MPTGETPSVTTLGHSLELCIPDVNTLSPWNPRATRQRTWKLQEESKGRQELFARFPGYLLVCLAGCSASVQYPACFVSRQLIADSDAGWIPWLLCWAKRQSPWKNACKNSVHVAIYNNSRRLSLTHGSKNPQDLQYSPRTKETNEKHRCRQWIIPGGGSFTQSPQMQEYEYFIQCIHEKESTVPYFCQRPEIKGDFSNSTHNEFGCANWNSTLSAANAGLIHFRQINPHYMSHHPPLGVHPNFVPSVRSSNDLSLGKRIKYYRNAFFSHLFSSIRNWVNSIYIHSLFFLA